MNRLRISLREIVMLLCLFVTVMTYILGCMMYKSNLKKIYQSLTKVELVDFIENINYGIHFGKKISTYYGIDSEMKLCVEQTERIDALYIIDFNGATAFATDPSPIPLGALELTEGNYEKGSELYCVVPLYGDSRIVSKSNISELQKSSRNYNIRVLLVTIAAFFIAELIFVLLWKKVTDRKKCHGMMLVMLILWIMIQCINSGMSNYNAYSSNIEKIKNAIEKTVASDEKRVEELGITSQIISGEDGYLRRFSDRIPEIQKIYKNKDILEIEISGEYLRRVFVDYLVQTLLFLTFSLMIIAEYRLFVGNATSVEEN